MKFYLRFLLISSCIIISFAASAQQEYWSLRSDKTGITTDKAVTRQSFPKEFKLFNLNTDPLRRQLFAVADNTARHSTIISLPDAEGNYEEFEVVEASNFDPALQARFPEIRAFSGKGITDKSALLKLSISSQGIQTMVFRTDRENEFIEPYSLDHTVYAVFKSNRQPGKLPWTCTTVDEKLASGINSHVINNVESSAGQLKTMRLAQSVTAEYSNYFGATDASQVGLVLAAINATLTRCNGCYENDLALHLNLIAASTNVIYYNPATDPYSPPAQMNNWNAELQANLTAVIGEANYDIGHLFGASGGGGNAGCIGCVCVNGQKGSGITSPADGIPMGDNFDIDYVTHEVGHQLGGNHTFSYANEGTGVQKEVGAGITIMGYAGITTQDPAPHSIDIYHETTIDQIQTNLAGKACPVTTNIAANNATPVVAALSNYTIPISTPFALTGSATDANAGDVLTYCWEQNDDHGGQTGNNSVARANKTVGPNWLTFPASTSPTRLCPRLSTILAGLLITPTLGGDAICNVEALSSVSRTLNFRLTVRDNCPYSSTAPVKVGQTAYKDMVVTVSNTSGPFQVSSPNTAVTWAGGSTQTITWAVNNTTVAPVSCANVKISLSIDGGQTFPTVLAASTPNDGTQSVTIPVLNSSSNTCRIKIEAIGNIFFDICDADFIITAPDIQFETVNNSQKEVTAATSGCRNYKDYTVNMKVMQPLTGSGSAVVTLGLDVASVAARGLDFDFTTNGNFAAPDSNLSFAVGGATIQPFTIRIYDDASVEGGESFTLNYTLNSGATDARPGTVNQTYTFTILDNDLAPHAVITPNVTIGSNNTKLTQPFRAEFNDSRTQILLTVDELTANGFYGSTLTKFSELAFNVVSKKSTVAFSGFTIKMKNTATTSLPGGSGFETGASTVYGPVSYSTVAGINNFVLATPFAWDGISNLLIEICYNNANGGGGRSAAADTVAGTSGYAVPLYQYDRSTTNGASGCNLATANFSFTDRPDVTLKQQTIPETVVESTVNSAQNVYLGPNADIYLYSTADTQLIARIQNLTAFDYGCTQVTIDRAGSSSAQFWNNTASNYLMSKSIKVVPANNTGAGHYQITLYYSAAEVTGWQTPTGRVFANNQVVKISNGFYIPDVTPGTPHTADIVIGPATTGTLGTNSTIMADFNNTGFSGFGAGYPCVPSTGEVIWTGAVNTDWANAGNWACGALPVPTSNVQINNGLSNYPVVGSNVTIKSLLLKPGAFVTVATGFKLTLAP